MNKLVFKLLSNQETIIDETTTYYISDDNLNFKIDKTLYRYNLTEDILYKKDKDMEMAIDLNNNIIYITLKENNATFNMPIEDTKINKKVGEISLKYTLNNDEIIKNEITIKY